MPDVPVKVRDELGRVLTVQKAALPVFLRRGCTVVTDEEIAVDREVAVLAADYALPTSTAGDPPPKSAPKSEWLKYAADLGVPDPDQFTKDELVDHLTHDTEEN